MTRLRVASPLFRCAVGILVLALFGAASSASVIYEYREVGSTDVIGTLEIMAPPATTSTGWSTVDSSDLISLFLDDGVFGLGPDNLLVGSTVFDLAIASVDGSKLDSAGMAIVFPTIPSPTPADPTIDRIMGLGFSMPSGADEIAGETFLTYQNGTMIGAEWVPVDGDWTVAPQTAVPEPASLTLLSLGLASMGARRWRQRKAS